MTPILKFIAKHVVKEKHLSADQLIENVLVIDLNYIGDMVMDSPVWRAIYDNLGIKADAWSYRVSDEALRANPFVGRRFLSTESFVDQYFRAMELSCLGYDLVINLSTSLKTNMLAALIGADLRLGYDYRGRGCFLNMRVPINHRVFHGSYRPDEVCRLLERSEFNFWIYDRSLIFNAPGKPKAPKDTAIVAMCTRSTRNLRMWNGWPKVIDHLIYECGLTVYLAVVPDDIDYARGVIQNVRKDLRHRCVVLDGSLRDLAWELSCAKICVTVNTATMHIAIAQQCPTVAVIGGTPPSIVFPDNDRKFRYVADPNVKLGKYEPAMHKISPDQVICLISEVMNA